MSLIQDVRYAVRMIRKRPVVSTLVILTLGLGIGANGIFFASFYGSALRPLPFEEPDRLVALYGSQPTLGEIRGSVSAPEYRDWTEGNPVFAGAGAFTWEDYNFQSSDEPDRIAGCGVTAGLFLLLGVDPLLGRHFLPEEDRPGGPLVALISYDVWTERFAADPRIVGRTVRLDGEVREIIGVMPKGFHFSHYGELWTPLQLDVARAPREMPQVAVIARLQRGISLAEAQAAMTAVAERLATLYPETHEGWTVDVHKLRDSWLPASPAAKLAMAGQLVLVAGVLLIVCANVTNVVLAQATVRRQERALRATLGASRGRLIRQTLVESTVLALGGGVLGALLASWTDFWFKSAITVPLPYWLNFQLERRGLAYILAVTVAAGIVVGLLPAVKSSGRDLVGSLKTGGGLEDRGSSWLRRGLVVGEYAVALVILVSGLLMVKSFENLRRDDRGFATENVLTLKLPLTAAAYDDERARSAFLDEALRRLDGLAETSAVGAANVLPVNVDFNIAATPLGAQGFSFPDGEEPRVLHQSVSADYFEALAIPRRAGRTFTAAEVSEGADAVILSASLAELLWPGEDALRRRVRVEGAKPGPWFEVVGVVGDVEPAEILPGFGAPTPHDIYLPLAGTASPSPAFATPRTPVLVLASHVAPSALVPSVRRELRAVDPSVPLFEVLSMEDVLDRFYFAQQAWSSTFSAMALLALVIAAVGVYGVTSYSVSRRVREMGVRIALGASPRRLLALVVRQGLVLAAVGIGLGLAAAVSLARAMQMLLHDMRAVDPGVFLTVVAVLLAVGFLASYGPARRAASADPIVALRDE